MTIKPRVYTRTIPYITIVPPARLWWTRPRSMQQARARHIACDRFEQEFHVFIAAYTPWFEHHLSGGIGVMLCDIEMQDQGTENRSVVELERALGVDPNRCRRCGQVLARDGKCEHCPGLPAKDEH